MFITVISEESYTECFMNISQTNRGENPKTYSRKFQAHNNEMFV